MEAVKIKKYLYFIGVDVSKNELDFAVRKGRHLAFHQEIKNETAEITSFIRELKTLPNFSIGKSVFCMEQTGIYCNHLITCLKRVKANVVCVGSEHIRQSIGKVRGKNDKVDAIRIAEYAYTQREELRLILPKRPIIGQLAMLNTLRNRLLNLQIAIQNPLKEQKGFVKKGMAKQGIKLCARSTEAIRLDIAEVEGQIAAITDSDARLKRLMEIITSVKSIGWVTALNILITTNEFKNINNPKKFACYSGVAPFKDESGKAISKARISHFANKKMKTLLHLCAATAKRTIPEIKAYFERKTVGEGKSKMSVLNAIRYKLILRIFACVNQDRRYEENYIRKGSILT